MPAAKKPAAKKPAAKKPAAKKAATKAKPAAKTRPAAKAKPARTAPPAPRPAAKAVPRVEPKPAQRRSKRTATARSRDEAARDVALFDNLAALRDLLAGTLVLTGERLQETLDDAVRRGRMLPGDAQELADKITAAGRRQLDDLVAEIEKRTK
jgi:outer membrane biosynthesis protein TonB